MDPLTQALQAGGAVLAEPFAVGVLSAAYNVERPLVGRQFQAWTLPGHLVQNRGQHTWRCGPLLGKDTD